MATDCPLPVIALLIERGEVVDGGEIRWGQVVRTAAGEVWRWEADSGVHGCAAEVVQ